MCGVSFAINMSRWEKSDAPKRKDAKKETTPVDVVSFFYLFPEAEVLLDGVWSFAASASLVAGSLEEAGGADEDGGRDKGDCAGWGAPARV